MFTFFLEFQGFCPLRAKDFYPQHIQLLFRKFFLGTANSPLKFGLTQANFEAYSVDILSLTQNFGHSVLFFCHFYPTQVSFRQKLAYFSYLTQPQSSIKSKNCKSFDRLANKMRKKLRVIYIYIVLEFWQRFIDLE